MYPASIGWVAKWYPSVHWVNQRHSSGIPVYTGPASVHWLRVRVVENYVIIHHCDWYVPYLSCITCSQEYTVHADKDTVGHEYYVIKNNTGPTQLILFIFVVGNWYMMALLWMSVNDVKLLIIFGMICVIRSNAQRAAEQQLRHSLYQVSQTEQWSWPGQEVHVSRHALWAYGLCCYCRGWCATIILRQRPEMVNALTPITGRYPPILTSRFTSSGLMYLLLQILLLNSWYDLRS